MKDLQLDLSEDATSRSPTADNMTEKHSKMEVGAIMEEESSQFVPPESTEKQENSTKTSAFNLNASDSQVEAPMYNDFLGRKQTQI